MDLRRVRTWLRDNPLAADVALAVGLALLTAAQIWAVANLWRLVGSGAPPLMGRRLVVFLPSRDVTTAYAVTAAAFLPLALRRHLPWVAVVLSGAGALLYEMLRMPPAFVVLAPMVALYTLAANATRRHVGVIAVTGGGVALAVSALAFTDARWLVGAVRTFVLLATAAFLGESSRSRRQYVAEVERRAAEAERTREEEARRRADEERLRIAREVHDVVAHGLSIVAVQAAAAGTLAETDPAAARESIGHIRATSRRALAELRSMLGVLRTGEGEPPLAPAPDLAGLDALVGQVREAGVEVALTVEGDLEAVPAVAAVSAYRIVQEALTNVVRHARAPSASVALSAAAGRLEIEVLDEGVGASATDLDAGHGIRGMAERAEALGGALQAGPRSDRGGFRVHAVLPTEAGS